jgi:hypothetical protein
MAAVFRHLRLAKATRCFATHLVSVALFAGVLFCASPAKADEPEFVIPERSEGWDDATKIMALSSAGLQLLMPRIFYSDPEVTVGWKARWHLSVLAPSMSLFAISLANDRYLKGWFESSRPDCNDANDWLLTCREYGLFSTPTLLAFSSLGQGTGIFLADTIKWSDCRFNAGAFDGNLGVPLVLTVITAVGRTAGNWESAGQVWTSAGVGVGVGVGMGLLYGLMQRPECGYSGGLLCW